ncbi:protein phosphatase Slingshot homolog 3 isoform X5 [Ciconia boyciana]|uniref:protein phosphatase Slingshot homolog 3 isoform X5 n=1 Tax=Ciconia boyciana TaxID=52775 RepID=UPI003B9ECAEC
MALVTVRRAAGSAGGPAEEDAPRRRQLQRRQSFVMVKGAALLLPAEEPLVAEPPPAAPPSQAPGQQEQHLQLMMQLLRPQDAIRLAVRLESARPQRVRYLLVVRPEEAGAEGQTALLGVDFAHEGAARCTLGMVLPLWSDTQVFLDGDGGFSVTSGGQTRIFKPISVQTMWAVLQELHRACEEASRGGHIPGGPALAWARGYAAALASEQSCLNEWLAMADLESVRPASPPPLRPATPELSEQAVRALLRDVMASADLESVTSKEVREELERRTGHSLARHKDFIDNEMLLVLAQMDRPSRVFPHLYLGSEWNAANLEELQQNRVTHILNVAREIDNFFPALFTYMNVRVYDEETAQLLPHWNDTFLFLSRVRSPCPSRQIMSPQVEDVQGLEAPTAGQDLAEQRDLEGLVPAVREKKKSRLQLHDAARDRGQAGAPWSRGGDDGGQVLEVPHPSRHPGVPQAEDVLVRAGVEDGGRTSSAALSGTSAVSPPVLAVRRAPLSQLGQSHWCYWESRQHRLLDLGSPAPLTLSVPGRGCPVPRRVRWPAARRRAAAPWSLTPWKG